MINIDKNENSYYIDTLTESIILIHKEIHYEEIVFIIFYDFLLVQNLLCQSFIREINITNPRMNGPDITFLQKRLLELGFSGVGESDGYYGPKTAGEIYFIKAALGFCKYIEFSENGYEGSDLDPRPNNYLIVNRELWNIIFNPENTIKLKNISLVRLFTNDPQVWEPGKNRRVTGLREKQLPYQAPEWAPPWGTEGKKVLREYSYDTGINKITIIETVESGWEYVTTIRDFTMPNGFRIIQTTCLESGPYLTISYSIPLQSR